MQLCRIFQEAMHQALGSTLPWESVPFTASDHASLQKRRRVGSEDHAARHHPDTVGGEQSLCAGSNMIEVCERNRCGFVGDTIQDQADASHRSAL